VIAVVPAPVRREAALAENKCTFREGKEKRDREANCGVKDRGLLMR
jgi:hypothetical protein